MDVMEFSSRIKWLGHDGFRIEGGKTIYIDPYEIGAGPRADLILISHEHFDHCSPADVQKIQGENTVIVTEKNSAAKLSGDVRVVVPGDSVELDGVTVSAVPAYNIGKDFHPKGNGWIGFIVEVDGIKVYHAGDTDYFPEMKDFEVDIALLPVSGTYVMTAEEAIQAAEAIAPELAIPMHYGAIVGAEDDARAFKSGLEGKIAVRILTKSTR